MGTMLRVLLSVIAIGLGWAQSAAAQKVYVTGGGYGALYSNAHIEFYCFGCKAHAETWIQGVTADACTNGTRNKFGACVHTGSAAYVFPTYASPVAMHLGYHFNCWTGVGKFFKISSSGTFQSLGQYTNTQCWPPPPRQNETTTTCPVDGPYWCPGTPIVVPLTNTPLRLSSPDVPFDLDANGTLDIVSWPEEASKFAFLAIDRNGDGVINNGSELFGDHTVPGADDGFSALLAMVKEELGRVPDIAEVNESNPLFSRLLLWVDGNRDGVSQSHELSPASSVLQAVGLGMTLTGKKDPEGNLYRYKGWARYRDGRTRKVYDIILTAGRQ